jgi:hypothetical protein
MNISSCRLPPSSLSAISVVLSGELGSAGGQQAIERPGSERGRTGQETPPATVSEQQAGCVPHLAICVHDQPPDQSRNTGLDYGQRP